MPEKTLNKWLNLKRDGRLIRLSGALGLFVSGLQAPLALDVMMPEPALPAKAANMQQRPAKGLAPADVGLARECAMTAAKASAAFTRGHLLVVDTRPATEYQQWHIPGALNMPMFAIKTKSFLKKHNFVIINQGRTIEDLQLGCVELRRAGFSQAHYISNGMLAWQAAGGVVEGRGEGLASTWIMPQEWVQELDAGQWKIVELSSDLLAGKTPVGVSRLTVSTEDDWADAVRRLQGIIAARVQQVPAERLLIVDNTGELSQKLEAHLQRTGIVLPPGVYYLTGGSDALRQYQRSHKSMLTYLATPRKRLPACR